MEESGTFSLVEFLGHGEKCGRRLFTAETQSWQREPPGKTCEKLGEACPLRGRASPLHIGGSGDRETTSRVERVRG
jgi:hypothetical protein